MKFSILQAALGSASILFSTQVVAAGHGHGHGHRHAHDQYSNRHTHAHQRGGLPGTPKAPRKATCSLPDHPDLVHVPGGDNNGFAMSPDEPCEDGKWCPIACVSGKVMAQWKPNTTYNYPESMVRVAAGLPTQVGFVVLTTSSTVGFIVMEEKPRSHSRTRPIVWMAQVPSRPSTRPARLSRFARPSCQATKP